MMLITHDGRFMHMIIIKPLYAICHWGRNAVSSINYSVQITMANTDKLEKGIR